MNLFGIGLLVSLIFLWIFSIVDRICKCVEQCNVGRAYGKFVSGVKVTQKEKQNENN